MKNSRQLVAIVICLWMFGVSGAAAQEWFGKDQTEVYTDFGNPATHVYGKGNTKYLFTMHRGEGRLYVFIFYKAKCIGRVEVKPHFGANELTSQLSRYRGDSSWKLVQELNQSTQVPEDSVDGESQPAMIGVEIKAWQRSDRRFYALWLSSDHPRDGKGQFLALGEKKAATAMVKYMEDITGMLAELVKATQPQ